MRKRAFFAQIWSKLLSHERRWGFLHPRDRILLAVSGGPDSVCLAHYLSMRGKRLGLELRIVHIHHTLRGISADRDAAFVLKLGMRLGLPGETVQVDVPGLAKRENRSLEEAARKLRYQTLGRIARRGRYRSIATGHTLSDHAETLLLHLLRGTDPKGLLGIPVKRPLAISCQLSANSSKIEVIRPLLCLTREEVLAYLKFFKLPSRTDPTNRDESFTRNWVRRKVIPLLKKKNPRLEEHLGLLSDKLRKMIVP